MKNLLNCKVVMLPTKKATQLFLSDDKETMSTMPKAVTSPNGQHLYLVSDREIKEGNWYYDNGMDAINQSMFPDELPPFLKRRCKKIEATTDDSLGKLQDCPIRGVIHK